jgi:hypothetical protein
MNLNPTDRLSHLRDFALAWEAGATVADVATATGMTTREASNLAANVRRHGVGLKRMPNPGNTGCHVGYLTESEWGELRRLVEHAAAAAEVKRRYRGA